LDMAKPLSVDTSFARANMRDMLAEVADKKMRFQIERYGKPLAVVISHDDYVKYVVEAKKPRKAANKRR